MKNYLFIPCSILLTIHTLAQNLSTVIQRGHEQAIVAVASSPDSNFVATGSLDRTAKIWDLTSGREIRTLFGHQDAVNSVAFSSDGKELITTSSDGTAKIWNVKSGELLFNFNNKERLTNAVFSPDKKLVALGGSYRLAEVYDYKSKKKITEIKVSPAQGVGVTVEFSPDGKWLALGQDNRKVEIYNTKTWEKAYTFMQEKGSCGGCPTWSVFTRDSQYLFMASDGGPVRHYKLSDGTMVKEFIEDQDDVQDLVLSQNEQTLYVIQEKGLVAYDIASGQGDEIVIFEKKDEIQIRESTLTSGNLLLLALDNGITWLYDADRRMYTDALSGILNQIESGLSYNPNSYWESHIALYTRLKNSIILTPNGKHLIKGKFGAKAKKWDIATGRTVMEYSGHEKAPLCLQLSRDGKKLLTGGGDGRIILWDTETGDTLKIIRASREPIFTVQFNGDETEVLSSGWDGTLKVFSLMTGQKLTHIDLENKSAYDVCYGPHGLYYLAAQLDFSLNMWEPDSKKIVRTFVGHTNVISSIKLHPNNRYLLSGSWDGSIRQWDITTGLMNRKFLGHQGRVYAIQYSHDEKHFYSGGVDRVVRMWDLETQEVTKTFEGHQAEVTCIIENVKDNFLITHSTDGITKFWDLSTGKEFFEHIHIQPHDWMVKTPEGYFTGTDHARKSIHFVDGLKTYSVDQFFNDFYRPDLMPEIFKSRGKDSQKENIQGKLEKSPPPTVQIASSPTDNPEEVEVYLKITDEGGGVKNIALFHNGKNVPIPKDALMLPKKKGESAVYQQKLRVIGGPNTFTASATNKDRIESEKVSIEHFSEHATKSSTCYILAVGINEYKNAKLSLNYAKPDAEAFSQLVNEKTGGLFVDVQLISLYDHEASSENILTKLDALAEQIKPQDVFIFYYAGHGSMVDDRFFFVPSEGTRLYDLKALQSSAIEASVLQERFSHIKALKQLIVMDACQSGGSAELLATRGGAEEKAIAQLSRSAGIHVMASAGSEQFATEFKELGHGLFTYVLIKGLEGAADGAPKDGKVTIYELKSYIDDQVPELTRKMKGKPQYPFTFSRGQDFPVVFEDE